MINELTIRKPNDMHVHFRDADLLSIVVPETDKTYQNCVVMPNLVPPITSQKMAIEYHARIKKYIKKGLKPLMTLYLTENINTDDMINAFKNNIIVALKLYPQGATTNSEKGVKNFNNIFNILSSMEENDIPLLVHGEDTDKNIDIFDREKSFIDKHLSKIINSFPKLRIVLEHITTSDAVQFVKEQNNVAATITPHHLASNRNDMLVGGIRPHLYCLPILKRRSHQEALIKIATSGNKKFFLGTDSAPHDIKLKENNCGCAGVFNTVNSLEILTQIFDQQNCLKNLERFVSTNSSNFYKLPKNDLKVLLIKTEVAIEFKENLKRDKISLKIYKPNFPVYWKIVN